MSEKTQPWTDEQRRDIHESVSWMAKQTRQGPDYHTIKAQRDALLEAYRKMKNVAAGYSNLCDDSASTSKLEREFEAADAIARAAIKAVEEA